MFDKNNICCHAGGEDRGCIMCCYGGIPEHVEPENCGDGSCEWFEKQLPDMREKVKEYISELGTEIDRCTKFIEDKLSKIKDNGKKEIYLFSIEYITLKTRVNTLTEVKDDLQGRLDELI